MIEAESPSFWSETPELFRMEQQRSKFPLIR